VGCFNCLEVCPFEAIQRDVFEERSVARVVQTLCQGCGNCASACRSGALDVKGFTDEAIYAQIAAPFEETYEEEEAHAEA